jgi:HEPN domain-containing protein
LTFDYKKTIDYWSEGAAYDLETGESLLGLKRFPYALFFGHLALEKLLKALVVKSTKEHAPFTHSLTLLASKAEIQIPDSILDQLAEFMEFHYESRYPDERKEFYKKCTADFARKKFTEIKEVYSWFSLSLKK